MARAAVSLPVHDSPCCRMNHQNDMEISEEESDLECLATT